MIREIPYELAVNEGLNHLFEFLASATGENLTAPKTFTKTFGFAFESEGTEVGWLFGRLDYANEAGRIEGMAVTEAARGLGAGTQLVRTFEQLALDEGMQVVFVDTSNVSAPKFYEKLGYEQIGMIPNYPTQSEDYYLYYKRLK